MRRVVLGAATALMLVALAGVSSAQDMGTTTFTVRIENVSGENTEQYKHVGIFSIPVGAQQQRPAMPGEAFEFTVRAEPGDRLAFTTMYGQSNDTFFGPNEQGIALFDESRNPINGDVSDQVYLWDAGTEVNEPLGQGPNQAPRQPAPNTGEAEGGVVHVVEPNDEFAPAADLMHVTLTAAELDQIIVRIENMSAGAPVPTPFSPGAYVVFSGDQTAPFFTEGEAERGQGLERQAEDGNPQDLGAAIAGSAVMNVGASPGVFVVHTADQAAPFFTTGEVDRGQGLEAQAEDGNPMTLGASVESAGFAQTGIFNTAVDATEPGPLMPGQAYEFTVTAAPGDFLNFALMFGQSNDSFFAPDERGIALFSGNGTPIMGTYTGAVQLWNAGTEVNEEPFVGPNQAPRQPAPNTGEAEGGVVQPIYTVDDGFHWPSVLSSLRVTITNDSGMEMNMMSMDMMMTPEADMMATQSMDMMATEAMMMPEATPAS